VKSYADLTAREIERFSRSIGPGEWAVEVNRPIATLLGSCVAVCLLDTGLPVAGMNHFMLPNMLRQANAEDALLAGDACMTALLNAMLARGASRHRLQAKAFGGGAVIDLGAGSGMGIGDRNAIFTREWLERERIPLVASDFQGPWARKVLLVPENGDAYCRRFTSSLAGVQDVRREEEAYAATLVKPQLAASQKVELF
jgi:chemotaxis protein CheD